MDLALNDRTALVTGASGGIGRAIALAFAAEGARVICHTHRAEPELRNWLKSQEWRDRAEVYQADLREPLDLDRFGRVDVCVANAGARPRQPEPLHEQSTERVEETIDVNLTGAIRTAQAFLRSVERHGGDGASLLFIGSTAASFGEAGWADYAAAKAGLWGLVQSLKNEIVRIDPRGRVNLVEPGWTMTHVPRPALEDPDAVTRVVRTMALRQLATADDIARTVVWLSSPTAARHVTGQQITVAGGMEGRLLWDRDEIDPRSITGR
jgi:3-oxoacyl-[acyl-carrier protein] reductase